MPDVRAAALQVRRRSVAITPLAIRGSLISIAASRPQARPPDDLGGDLKRLTVAPLTMPCSALDAVWERSVAQLGRHIASAPPAQKGMGQSRGVSDETMTRATQTPVRVADQIVGGRSATRAESTPVSHTLAATIGSPTQAT